jgi:hypothetical protein
VNPKDLESLIAQMPAAIAVIRGPELRYELSNALNTEFAGGRKLEGKTVFEALPELQAQGLTALVKHVYECWSIKPTARGGPATSTACTSRSPAKTAR